jgi:RimJ/RimL family protein N-acetyltransferase
MMKLETERLTLRQLTTADTPLILAVLNDPDFLRFVGDRKVRTEEDARAYLANGPLASYLRHGFGPYAVELRPDGVPIGICGLFKRDHLPQPDVGFALLPAWRSKGYAGESARAVLADSNVRLGLSRVLAIVDPANERSVGLLKRLGLHATGMLPAEDGVVLACYAIDFPSRTTGPVAGGTGAAT